MFNLKSVTVVIAVILDDRKRFRATQSFVRTYSFMVKIKEQMAPDSSSLSEGSSTGTPCLLPFAPSNTTLSCSSSEWRKIFCHFCMFTAAPLHYKISIQYSWVILTIRKFALNGMKNNPGGRSKYNGDSSFMRT